MFGNTVWESALQRHIRPEALSRVSAYDWFGSLAFAPLGLAIWGPRRGGHRRSARRSWLAAGVTLVSTLRDRWPCATCGAARLEALGEHAGVHDPGRVAALLERAQQLEPELAVLGLQPRPVVAADRVVVRDRRARGGDRVAGRALRALPLADRVGAVARAPGP